MGQVEDSQAQFKTDVGKDVGKDVKTMIAEGNKATSLL
jgi:hypothetical protein